METQSQQVDGEVTWYAQGPCAAGDISGPNSRIRVIPFCPHSVPRSPTPCTAISLFPFPTSLTAILPMTANAPQYTYPPPVPPPATVQGGTAGGAQAVTAQAVVIGGILNLGARWKICGGMAGVILG